MPYTVRENSPADGAARASSRRSPPSHCLAPPWSPRSSTLVPTIQRRLHLATVGGRSAQDIATASRLPEHRGKLRPQTMTAVPSLSDCVYVPLSLALSAPTADRRFSDPFPSSGVRLDAPGLVLVHTPSSPPRPRSSCHLRANDTNGQGPERTSQRLAHRPAVP
ncbi:hypothetical protein FKP32DRAFT_1675067 [Trametes sanguinea]|nr:hypothetical protein FKP32DRAFT_1675067 [Trametes sanguinea]